MGWINNTPHSGRITGPKPAGRKSPMPRGYAAAPGTGPAGETCGTCRHLARHHCARSYPKCRLMEAVWTGGAATDVRVRSPACRRWEAP
jgi:hypothetical protein